VQIRIKIDLPDIETANRQTFAEIAVQVRDFIGWYEENNKRVDESELIRLKKLSEILSSKRRIIENELEKVPINSEEPKKPLLPKKKG